VNDETATSVTHEAQITWSVKAFHDTHVMKS